MIKRKKYVVIFLIKENDSYSVLSRKRFMPSKSKVRYGKGKSHIIDTSKPTYIKGLRLFYFVEINKGQIGFNNPSGNISPEVIDMVMSQSIVKQLTANLAGMKFNFMNIITGLAVGGLVGYILGAML